MSLSYVTFPAFSVVDGSWGSVKLTISTASGMTILSKKSDGQHLENWPWNEISHATIKSVSKFLVQFKKPNGIKKLVTFESASELERFELVLKNAAPILELLNMWRQRKFLVIQASNLSIPIELKALPETKDPALDSNGNVQGLTAIPPPPPPPLPLMESKLPISKKDSAAGQKKMAQPVDSLHKNDTNIQEMQDGFKNGIIKPSQVKARAAVLNSIGKRE